MTTDDFSALSLPEAQLANLAGLGYAHMTPIQAAALPAALRGEDLIAQAKTGSGKTAVFALAILSRLDVPRLEPQALVLCPTRELSLQVAAEMRRLARYRQNVKITTIYGGQPISLQKQSLKHGTHVVVGTPGRILDHLEKKSLRADTVTTLVLDEADRMLEMGFIRDIEAIIGTTPDTRQTLLFSATFPENIRLLSDRFQRNPQHLVVDARHEAAAISEHFYTCGPDEKNEALRSLLLREQPATAVVFCNFKQTTRDVCDFLVDQGFSALALNGDLEQRDREEILIRFKHQSCVVLVATDVAARGLDIKDLPVVINYELPSDPEVYTHRIGRTGRAGSTGRALTLCSGSERGKVRAIQAARRTAHEPEPIATLRNDNNRIPEPSHVTFCIAGGRRDKIRPGEILGALTGEHGITGTDVGKIDVLDYAAYVAIRREAAAHARRQLTTARIKGRTLRVREL